jgi:hypothetical protein
MGAGLVPRRTACDTPTPAPRLPDEGDTSPAREPGAAFPGEGQEDLYLSEFSDCIPTYAPNSYPGYMTVRWAAVYIRPAMTHRLDGQERAARLDQSPTQG